MISRVHALGLGALTAAFALFAGCGSNVVGVTGSGTTGSGAGGSGGFTSTGDGCTDPSICSGGATTGQGGFGTTGPGSGGSTAPGAGGASPGTGGAGGGGQICGGFPGSTCAPEAYCEYSDHECGGNDGAGVCTPRPQGCGTDYEPTCGCGGTVYDNPCLAAQAGADLDDLGGCTAPAGMFGCGLGFCDLASEYCGVERSAFATTYGCMPLPAGCGSSPACDCLSQVNCGSACMSTADGGLEVTCVSN